MLHGHCYCGEITYTVDDVLGDAILCHCTTCQRMNTGMSHNVVSQVDKLVVTSPQKTKVYVDTNTTTGKPMHRNFCPTCGSSLFVTQDNTLYLKTGALDEGKLAKIKAQIYSEDALDGMVKDGVPQIVVFKKP
ncbi:Mss4-like protein [Auriculariales sp. MPI-PUGE-AT-0066]|nr:Mss4-like protein [Auriculariales sp. MPI-PUGE-AT-0066]